MKTTLHPFLTTIEFCEKGCYNKRKKVGFTLGLDEILKSKNFEEPKLTEKQKKNEGREQEIEIGKKRLRELFGVGAFEHSCSWLANCKSPRRDA